MYATAGSPRTKQIRKSTYQIRTLTLFVVLLILGSFRGLFALSTSPLPAIPLLAELNKCSLDWLGHHATDPIPYRLRDQINTEIKDWLSITLEISSLTGENSCLTREASDHRDLSHPHWISGDIPQKFQAGRAQKRLVYVCMRFRASLNKPRIHFQPVTAFLCEAGHD